MERFDEIRREFVDKFRLRRFSGPGWESPQVEIDEARYLAHAYDYWKPSPARPCGGPVFCLWSKTYALAIVKHSLNLGF